MQDLRSSLYTHLQNMPLRFFTSTRTDPDHHGGHRAIDKSILANLVGLRVMQDLRSSLYTHLQNMPLRIFTFHPDRRSSRACRTTSAACRRSSPTPRRRSSNT